MTRQTAAPLQNLSLHSTARSAREVANMVRDGYLTLDAPYQRDDVWTNDQRIALVRSWLIGIPVPAVIINDRRNRYWEGQLSDDEPCYVAVDGKQRIRTAVMWFSGELLIPASWIPAGDIESGVVDTDDGPYVAYTGLTRPAQSNMGFTFQLPMVEGKIPSVQMEAEVYLLVNGAGTPQTGADMARAARIATDS